ncbi:MAG: heme o synthase [Candidatus Thermoplasmatota archaeon]|nr:heme o synthase [Candidatus Thermoplasmatota archaeon]
MNFHDFSRIYKIEITFLVDIVAISAFLSNPFFHSHIILLAPLLISGTLASMSAALFNNIYDIDIDSSMKRTASRSSVLNVGNRKKYIAIGISMLIVSTAISYFTINALTSIFIFGGFLSYVFLYTVLLKRRTSWNIVIGGVAGSFPALAGWASISNDVSFTSIFIAGLIFLWTPTHFWSLAVGNVDDYVSADIPMLPAIVGVKNSFKWILINTIVLIAYSIIPFFTGAIRVGIFYFLLVIILDAIMIYFVIVPRLKGFLKSDFRKIFHYSNYYLLILLVSICLVSLHV